MTKRVSYKRLMLRAFYTYTRFWCPRHRDWSGPDCHPECVLHEREIMHPFLCRAANLWGGQSAIDAVNSIIYDAR